MKRLFLLLALCGMVAVGCTESGVDDNIDNGGNEDESDIPENIFFGLDKESVTFSPDGGSVDVVVYSNYKWEISGTSDWCTPSITKGNANEDGQKVTFSADVAYDDREVTFWFRCADEKIKFVVSQKLKKVIIPDANNSFDISAEGGIAVISYKTSVDCVVIIPEEAQDWITIAPATRGLVSEDINLDIAENTTYDPRTAVIKVVAKDNAELVVEYTINQEQNDAILADESNTFTVPNAGGKVIIKYQTNVGCEVIIPEEAQDWITIVPATRGLVSESVTLNIAENTTYDPRTAVIKVVAKDNAELVVEYTINQEQTNALLADENNTFTVPGKGGKVVIKYQTNVDCEVIIPEEAQDWITIAPATRGLVTYNTTLNITANNSGEQRSSVVKVVSQDHNELFAEYNITQNPKYSIYFTKRDSEYDVRLDEESFDATILYRIYQDGVYEIVFDAPITTIGAGAFRDCDNLASITIPNSVTTIGASAFRDCDNLTSITIPNSVTTIGAYAFDGCRSLTSVTIPDSVTSIGDSTFDGCRSLTSINIPNSVTEIGYNAFRNCSSLRSITIPNSVTTIGEGAFYNCMGELIINSRIIETDYTYSDYPTEYGWLSGTKFTDLTIGEGIEKIGEQAFRDCSSLTNVTIGNDVTMIGESAFAGCNSITSVTIGDSVTELGEYLFSSSSLQEFKGKCASEDGRCLIIEGVLNYFAPAGLTKYAIPDSVTKIGKRAFAGCGSITSVTIPDSVTSIGSEAFDRCSSLTSVTIGDSVTTIGSEAFYGCRSLTSVTIPDSVTSIGSYAFYDCSSLTSVTIPDSVTSIGDSTFDGCRSLTSINIPNSVTEIGRRAFGSCYSLTSVTIPDSVTSIGSEAFSGCTRLTNITIPNSVTSIGGSAFSSCKGELIINSKIVETDYTYLPVWLSEARFTKIIIGKDIEKIGEQAFRGCSSLTSITIPNSVTSIGDYAFSGCTGELIIHSKIIETDYTYYNYPSAQGGWISNAKFTKLTIGEGIEKIGSYAFADCDSITSVIIGDIVTSIGKGAFTACDSITSAIIGNNVTSIGNSAFDDCSSLTSVTIGDSVTKIGSYAFYGCSSLTSVTIPDSVTTIGSEAFYDCSSLTSVTIPDSVTSIGDYAFYRCNSLKEVYCKATTPPAGGSDMFYGNASDRKIYVPRNSVSAYKSAKYWSDYKNYIVGYDF